MNWQAVREELAKPEYADRIAAGDWEGIAREWNESQASYRDTVERDVLQNALMQIPAGPTTLWFALRAIARDPSHPLHQLADAVVYVVEGSLLKAINLDNPAVAAMLDQLQAAGLVTEAQKAAIRSLGDHTTTKARLIAGRPVEPVDLYNAWVTRNG